MIGNDHYRYTTPLQTAVNDAHAVQTVLQDRYGFEVRLLTDASRDDIMTALGDSRNQLNADSDLLVYYAGHGYYDTAVERAYWLPIDARVSNAANWISADDIAANMKGTAARHILIVSDSCFSGTLTRGLNDTGAGLQSVPWPLAARLRRLGEDVSLNDLASQVRSWKRCKKCQDSGYRGHAIERDLESCDCPAATEARFRDIEDWPQREIERVHQNIKTMLIAASRGGSDFLADALERAEIQDDGRVLTITPGDREDKIFLTEMELRNPLWRIRQTREVRLVGPH